MLYVTAIVFYVHVDQAVFSTENKKADSEESALAGAEDEIRTRDPRLGKAMLYH